MGPQPAQPIKPPPGYVAPPPPDAEAAKPTAAPGQAAAAEPAPPPPKCPADVGALLTAKVKATKEKKKRYFVSVVARADGAEVSFKKVVRSDGGAVSDAKLAGAEATAYLAPTHPKDKMTVIFSATCGWEERLAAVVLDPRGPTVSVREAQPPPEPGYLSVLADAGTKVSSAGRELGVAPLREVPMPPGKYSLRLEPKRGKAKVLAVEITSGQTTNVALDPPKRK